MSDEWKKLLASTKKETDRGVWLAAQVEGMHELLNIVKQDFVTIYPGPISGVNAVPFSHGADAAITSAIIMHSRLLLNIALADLSDKIERETKRPALEVARMSREEYSAMTLELYGRKDH